jgi:MFS family permease
VGTRAGRAGNDHLAMTVIERAGTTNEAAAARGAQRGFVVLLAGVLALEGADLGTVGAVAGPLERSLGLTHAQLGLLASAGTLLGALATIPAGVLADRVPRVPVLVGVVVSWALAMAAVGASDSFLAMLASRASLGALTACAGPFVLSLTGDVLSPGERARSYALILAGDMVGSGVGFLVGGSLAGILSWRWSFWVLVVPALALAAALRRHLPEPRRGGAGESGVMSLIAALRIVLGVRTNVLLLAATTANHFFFAGVRTFTVLFVVRHYELSHAAATWAVGALGVGALLGTVAGGRVTDALLARGHRDARIVVPATALVATAVLWVAPLLIHTVWLGLALGVPAAAVMSIPNAPLDAARLDVIPARLRGRAESVRTILRGAAFSVAPVVFGWVADQAASGHGTGMRDAFLVMLVPLALSGLVLLRARRTYPPDMAAARRGDERPSAETPPPAAG